MDLERQRSVRLWRPRDDGAAPGDGHAVLGARQSNGGWWLLQLDWKSLQERLGSTNFGVATGG
jgi:hypothetical protein